MKKISIYIIFTFFGFITTGYCSETNNLQKTSSLSFSKCANLGVQANSLCIRALDASKDKSKDKIIKNFTKQNKKLQNEFHNLMNKNSEQLSEVNEYKNNIKIQNTFKGQMTLVNAAERYIKMLEATQNTLIVLDKATVIVKLEMLSDIKTAASYCYTLLQNAKSNAESNINLLTSEDAKERLNERIAKFMNKSLLMHDSVIDEIQMQKVLDSE